MRFFIPIFFVTLFILSIGTRLNSSDAQVMYETSRALALEHRFALPEDFGLPQIRQTADGAYYSQYDPGLPLLAAPLVWFSDTFAKQQLWNRYAFSAYTIMFISALGVASGLLAISHLANDIYQQERLALAVALVAGLCTPLWAYACMFFAEGLLAGCLSLAFFLVWRKKPLWAGLALGITILTRAAMIIYLPPLVFLMWSMISIYPHPFPPPQAREGEKRLPCPVYGEGDGGRGKRKQILTGLRFLLFPVLAVVGLLYHNYLRGGDPFTFSYQGQGFTTPVWEGVFGLLFSPGKSIFLYAPPLVLSVWMFPRFRRRVPPLAHAILFASLAALLFYGSWWAWHGGWCWGPRFLVPLIPVWMLPLGELAFLKRSRALNAAITGVVLAGFVIALLGVFTDVNRHYARYDVVNYTLNGSPLVGAARSALAGQFEPLGSFHLRSVGWLPVSAFLFPLVLGIACGGCFMVLLRQLHKVNHNEQ